MLKIPFFRKGRWSHPKYGTISADQGKFDQFKKNFKENILGRQPFIRIGHSKDSSSTFGDAEAKAWISDIVQEGDVLYALAEATDPKVEEDIRNKKYRFASAEYSDNYFDKESGKDFGTVLSAIALTNEPFLTRLPENVVLSDDPETFYLDYKNMEGGNVMEELIKKMTELFNSFIEKLKGQEAGKEPVKQPEGGEGAKKNDVPETLLAEFEAMKKKLSEFEGASKTLLADNEILKKDVEAREIDLKLSELKQKGIPPVLCDKAKEILLAAPGTETIKLSDGSEKKLSDMVYGLLEALPESARVPFSQSGSQEVKKCGEPTADEIKKLAEEDIKALGGKVDADGKFVI